MQKITIEVDDEIGAWLTGLADDNGLSVEEAVMAELRRLAKTAAGPGWRERDVFTCLRRMDGRPGRGVPLKSVMIHWQKLGGARTNDDFFMALDELSGRKWIEALGPTSEDIILTSRGYEAMP